METAVLMEILKSYWHRGEEPRVYFWRTSGGVEVDFVVEHGSGLIPIEVKLSGTPRSGMAANIRAFQDDFGTRAGDGFVVHPGDMRLPLAPGVEAIPFAAL